MEEETVLFGYTMKEITAFIVEIGTNLLAAVAILVIGLWLAKKIVKRVRKILDKRNLDEGLKTFLGSLIGIGIKALVIITAISQLGIEMTSFVAILGAAGLAIGMAFSGTLSNFAGGVMLLAFRHFKVGDFVKVNGEEGTVKEIQIFNTILVTPDNKTIILPNGPLANGNITNYTTADLRRVDFEFGFGYGEDYQLARKTVMDLVNAHEAALKDPEPFIGLGSMGDSAVNIKVRVWTKKEDYWPFHFYLNEAVYKTFSETEGLSIPYPQMDVHLDKV